MMGVTWKGSDVVVDARSIKALDNPCLGGPTPKSALGLRTDFSFGFYFTYASALGRCPAPGEGNPD
jgi:hypothetical protein